MNPYAPDEFLANLLSSDPRVTSLVGGAVYRFRQGLSPKQHPHVLIRRTPEPEAARFVSRGVFTCTAVVCPSLIANDTRPPELIAGPIAAAILAVLRDFEEDDLPASVTTSADGSGVWGGQILIPDYSMSYGLPGDTPGAASPSTLELGVTIRIWAS